MTKNQVIVNKPNLLHVHFDLQWIKNLENTNLKRHLVFERFNIFCFLISTIAKPLCSFLIFFPKLEHISSFSQKVYECTWKWKVRCQAIRQILREYHTEEENLYMHTVFICHNNVFYNPVIQ
jgi:hypothetical protein